MILKSGQVLKNHWYFSTLSFALSFLPDSKWLFTVIWHIFGDSPGLTGMISAGWSLPPKETPGRLERNGQIQRGELLGGFKHWFSMGFHDGQWWLMMVNNHSLVISNIWMGFSISYMGCHPKPIDELVQIFQDGYIAPPTRVNCIWNPRWPAHIWDILIINNFNNCSCKVRFDWSLRTSWYLLADSQLSTKTVKCRPGDQTVQCIGRKANYLERLVGPMCLQEMVLHRPSQRLQEPILSRQS